MQNQGPTQIINSLLVVLLLAAMYFQDFTEYRLAPFFWNKAKAEITGGFMHTEHYSRGLSEPTLTLDYRYSVAGKQFQKTAVKKRYFFWEEDRAKQDLRRSLENSSENYVFYDSKDPLRSVLTPIERLPTLILMLIGCWIFLIRSMTGSRDRSTSLFNSDPSEVKPGAQTNGLRLYVDSILQLTVTAITGIALWYCVSP